jgi:hypothetical protein
VPASAKALDTQEAVLVESDSVMNVVDLPGVYGVTVKLYTILLSEQYEFVPTVKAERLYEKDGLVKI